HMGLAKLFYVQKKWDEGLKEVEATNQLTKDHDDPWLFEAFADGLAGKGDKKSAADAYLKARGTFRDRGQAKEALECTKKAVALQPQSSAAHMALGESLSEAGSRSDAISELREAMKLDPNNLQ